MFGICNLHFQKWFQLRTAFQTLKLETWAGLCHGHMVVMKFESDYIFMQLQESTHRIEHFWMFLDNVTKLLPWNIDWFCHKLSFRSYKECWLPSFILIPWIMVRICSFKKEGPWALYSLTALLSCNKKNLHRDFHGNAACYFGYLHSIICNFCIIWDNHPFLYRIFVQHWTCDSGFIHYYVYFSLYGNVDTGSVLKSFSTFFHGAYVTGKGVSSEHSLLKRKHFSYYLLHMRHNTQGQHHRLQCR
jgi:hypothetical protein